MVFYTLILQFCYKKMGKRKKEDDTFYRKKTEKKQNSATMICISRWKKDFFSSEVEITRDIVLFE